MIDFLNSALGGILLVFLEGVGKRQKLRMKHHYREPKGGGRHRERKIELRVCSC